MPNKTNLNRLALGLLASMLFSTAYAQSTMGSLEETLTTAQKNIINQNSLDQAPTGLDDCELKYPFPPSNRSSIYDEGGADFCKKLRIRGQRMMCEIDALALEKPSGPSTTGSKIELASWSRCNLKVASVLVEGYYMPASEIERRLQICSSNYYADPGKLPKQGFYQRFLRWATSNDLTPATTDQALEVSIKQSTPLENQQDIAGLMKCDWMYSRSRSPVIDVLPGGSSADKPSYSNAAPVKKAPSNKTSPKPAAQ
jgi:hypothetical protein